MKNAVKNTAIVLLALTTIGLTAKVVNDSNGWLDKIIAKEPASENYLQIGDELLGKTVYFDYAAYATEINETSFTFGLLETDATEASDREVTTKFNLSGSSFNLGVSSGPAFGGYLSKDYYSWEGLYKIGFGETIHIESAGYVVDGTSLKITGLNQTIDLNRYFAYSEEALSEWKDYRKNHPFVKPEITEPDAENYLQVGDSLLGKTLYVNVDHLNADGISLQGSQNALVTLNSNDSGVTAYLGAYFSGFGLHVQNVPNTMSDRIDGSVGGIQALTIAESYVDTTSYDGAYPISITSLTVKSFQSGIDMNRYFSWTEDGTTKYAEYKAALFGQTSDSDSQPADSETSETEVKEKAKTETYAQEIVPIEDEDGRFGAFC